MVKHTQSNFNTFVRGLSSMAASAAAPSARSISTVHKEVYTAYRILRAPPEGEGSRGLTEETRLLDARIGLYRVLVAIGAATKDPEGEEPVDLIRMAKWKTWIGTMAHLVFEDHLTIEEVKAGVVEVKEDDAIALGIFKRGVNIVGGFYDDEADVPSTSEYEDRFNGFVRNTAKDLGLPHFEELPLISWWNMVSVGSMLPTACYYALIVYLCGRPVSGRTDAIGTRRPKNLVDKFNNGQPWVEITGPLKSSRGTWIRVGEAWELDPAFRVAYFRPLVTLPRQHGGSVANAVATMVSLLQYAQMSHLSIIHDFLRAYPFAAGIPSLSREMFILASDMELLRAIPIDEQPFAKVLRRDTFKGFDGKELSRLTKLAVDILQVNSPELAKYAVKDADSELKRAFDAAAALEKKKGKRVVTIADDESSSSESEPDEADELFED